MGRVYCLLMLMTATLSRLTETDQNYPVLDSEDPRASDSRVSLNVKWMAPDKANGIITKYRVKWTWEDGADDIQVNGTSTTSYTITGLAACINYSVTVAAATSEGFGVESDPVSRVTNIGAPPAPSVTCGKVVSPHQLAVTWPPVDTQCPVGGYKVNYTGDVLWSDNTRQGSQELYTTYADLSDLTPWTTYTVCVAGVVGNDIVGAWDCCSSTTLEAAPGKPSNLEQTSSTTSSVTVSWTEPEERNGALTEYQVVWPDGFFSLSAGATTFTINGLHPKTQFNVTVQAGTSVGWGPPAMIQVTTNKSPNIGALVGGVVGGIVGGLLFLVAVAAVVFFKRKRNDKKKSTERRSSRPDMSMAPRISTVSCSTSKNDKPTAYDQGSKKELDRRKNSTFEPIAVATSRSVKSHNPYYIHEKKTVMVLKEHIYENPDEDSEDPIYMTLD
ncbi:netrin receptor unc-40 isoform X1 [Procambarus clarkii]|uniref:netrin receptor unc-40 isoform X1 n=2 Tax=Procambarus clarkii TaxID=6728 RepID=UPI003743425B